MTDLSPESLLQFYEASLLGLRYLDSQPGGQPRFGPEADARWSQFAGHLQNNHRVDLLLRDAAVAWGAAFSGALVYQLPGLSVDEPFGPDWPGIPSYQLEAMWKQTAKLTIESAEQAIQMLQSVWDVPSDAPWTRPQSIGPTTRIVVSGSAAILQAGQHFANDATLSWSEQITAIADSPRTRHLAGLMAIFTRASKPTSSFVPDRAIYEPEDLPSETLFSMFGRVDALWHSSDTWSSNTDQILKQLQEGLR